MLWYGTREPQRLPKDGLVRFVTRSPCVGVANLVVVGSAQAGPGLDELAGDRAGLGVPTLTGEQGDQDTAVAQDIGGRGSAA